MLVKKPYELELGADMRVRALPDEPANKAHQETINTYDMTDVAWKALQLGLTQAVIQGGFEGVAVLLDNSLNAHVVEALAKSVLNENQVYIHDEIFSLKKEILTHACKIFV